MEGIEMYEDLTEVILRKYLDGDFTAYPMAKTSTSPSLTEAIERQFGVRYPAEFIAHICGRFPGIYVEVKEEIWPRPKKLDVGPFWSLLYALHTYTSAPESEDWMHPDAAARLFQQETGLAAAPVLKIVRDADLYCVDADAAIVRYRHEGNQLEPTNKNFWDVFEQEIAELADRRTRKKTGSY